MFENFIPIPEYAFLIYKINCFTVNQRWTGPIAWPIKKLQSVLGTRMYVQIWILIVLTNAAKIAWEITVPNMSMFSDHI